MKKAISKSLRVLLVGAIMILSYILIRFIFSGSFAETNWNVVVILLCCTFITWLITLIEKK